MCPPPHPSPPPPSFYSPVLSLSSSHFLPANCFVDIHQKARQWKFIGDESGLPCFRLYSRCRVLSSEYIIYASFSPAGKSNQYRYFVNSNLITLSVVGMKQRRINRTWPTSINCLMIDPLGFVGALRLCINSWMCVIKKGHVTALQRGNLKVVSRGKCMNVDWTYFKRDTRTYPGAYKLFLHHAGSVL